MTNENRDTFAARLRHELTQETHVVVGDHDPEPITRQMGKRRALAMGYRSGTMREDEYLAAGTSLHEAVERDNAQVVEYVWPKSGRVPHDVERQLDLYSFALTGGPRIPDVVIQDEHIFYVADDDELAAIDGAAHHPLGDTERERVVNQMTEAPVDSPVCKCHDRMGNDWYFLPSGTCLFDINECTDPTRRQTKP